MKINQDDKLQRLLGLDSFFSNAGYKEFNEQVEGFVIYADTKVGEVLKNAVSPDDLERLNYNLGVRQGLQMVLNLIQGFKDDLEEKSASQA